MESSGSLWIKKEKKKKETFQLARNWIGLEKIQSGSQFRDLLIRNRKSKRSTDGRRRSVVLVVYAVNFSPRYYPLSFTLWVIYARKKSTIILLGKIAEYWRVYDATVPWMDDIEYWTYLTISLHVFLHRATRGNFSIFKKMHRYVWYLNLDRIWLSKFWKKICQILGASNCYENTHERDRTKDAQRELEGFPKKNPNTGISSWKILRYKTCSI